MSRAASSHRPFWPSYIALLLFIVMLTLSTTLQRVGASPLPGLPQIFGNPTPGNSTENSTASSTKNSMENSTDNSMENSMENSAENSMENSTENSAENSTDNSTDIAPNTDVYVIKAIVYEIGILTDTDNTTSSESSESTERQESINISLYSAPQEDEFS